LYVALEIKDANNECELQTILETKDANKSYKLGIAQVHNQ